MGKAIVSIANARAIISFYIADREGWAQVKTMPGEEFNPFNLAAAIEITLTPAMVASYPRLRAIPIPYIMIRSSQQ